MEGRAVRPRSDNSGINDESVNTRQQRILNNLVANMVYVQGGTFLMGGTSEQGDEAEDDEKPILQVTLSSFYIEKYEVTQEEWKTVMGDNPSYHRGDKYPVADVSWNYIQKFITKLNQLTGRQFRLPTEADWEFAARGGNNSRHYKYSGSNYIGSIAWYGDNSNGTLHDVDHKQPNELGLYDMSGNVSEWCSDYYGFDSPNAQKDPKVTSPTKDNIPYGNQGYIKMGLGRIIRGGSYARPYNNLLRVSYRYCSRQDYYSNGVGFRLAM